MTAVKTLTTLVAATVLSACALPQTTVRSGSSQPNLIVKGAPRGSTLFVDDLRIGSATKYDGHPNVLAVLEGTHRVEIRRGGSVLYSEKTFVGVGETHTVLVIAGTAR